MVALRGMTWDHPRGLAPLVATAEAFARQHDVTINWDARSLHAFGAQPLAQLARDYDLLIIDHPFVGAVAAGGYLLPLDEYLPAAFLDEQARQSVGASHRSYFYAGHQWALAVDAAAQVSAYRPDLLAATGAEVPRTWDDVLALTRRQGAPRVAIPLTPVNAISSFFTLCANHGVPPCRDADRLVSRATGRRALELLHELAAHAHPDSLDLDPPGALDRMANTDEIAYCPLLFGYSNYARPGFAPHLISFANIPTPRRGDPPRGSLLGGTGLAISSSCRAVADACAYAQWVASADCQRTLYVESGGQPGNRVAWTALPPTHVAPSFYAPTIETLDLGYLRPRYYGYVQFQDEAGEMLNEALRRGGNDVDATLDALDAMYARSREGVPAEAL